MSMIPCQNCRSSYPETWTWYVCDRCGFRICATCLGAHSGPYGTGTFKCSQCSFGHLGQR